MAALSQMAVLRETTAGKTYLHTMAVELSRENVTLVMEAIRRIGRQEREEGEPALPSFGRIMREMGAIADESHPLRLLREMVRKMALNFRVKLTPELLDLFSERCGHRTDADLTTGYNLIINSQGRKQIMPTTAEFLDACGILTRRRDGSRPDDDD